MFEFDASNLANCWGHSRLDSIQLPAVTSSVVKKPNILYRRKSDSECTILNKDKTQKTRKKSTKKPPKDQVLKLLNDQKYKQKIHLPQSLKWSSELFGMPVHKGLQPVDNGFQNVMRISIDESNHNEGSFVAPINRKRKKLLIYIPTAQSLDLN